jgi:hypothetical protein
VSICLDKSREAIVKHVSCIVHVPVGSPLDLATRSYDTIGGAASLVPRPSLDLPAFNVARKSWEIERGPGDEATEQPLWYSLEN